MAKSPFNSKPIMVLLSVIFFSAITLSSGKDFPNKVGINYGTQGDNLLSPYRSIELIRSMKVGYVKLYDANPETLKLLAGTNLRVAITVPTQDIPTIASNQATADRWVHDNIVAYYPQTKIRLIMVGKEVWGTNQNDPNQWARLVPAMRLLRNSLRAQGLRNVKLSTPLAMDVLETGFPPSNGTFKKETSSTLIPLLHLLNKTSSYLFLNVQPYFSWAGDPSDISLDFALFKGRNLTYTDPDSRLVYTNLLDQMLDSIHFAMSKLGFPHVRLGIAETGWPNNGDVDQPGANVYNSATYNRNLIRRITADPPVGTPARPRTQIPTFLSSLYDENLRGGPGTERHWGLLREDGTPVYDIDLTGVQSEYGPLPEPVNNERFRGRIWCVVSRAANLSELGGMTEYTCNQLNGECEALRPAGGCYEPVSMVWHASYAFSAYWARFRSAGATCYFNGLASQTTINPSHGSCRFPSVTLN